MAQGKPTSNIGVGGIESIRIAGMQIQDLPMVAAAHAKMQLPLALDNARKQKIKTVLKDAPTQKVPYLESRITEAQKNINDQTAFKAQIAQKIAQYQGQKDSVDYGRQQLKLLDPDGKIAQRMGRIGASRILAEQKGEEFKEPHIEPEVIAKYEQIKSIRVQYPSYDKVEMQKQIDQFRDAILKADDVIKQEYESIAELTGVLSLCKQRDEQLKALGAHIK
jgi:hypothetical protein